MIEPLEVYVMIGDSLNQGKYPVLEKCTEPKVVAFTRFADLQEAGRQIWLVRDWIREHGLLEAGSPLCAYWDQDGIAGVPAGQLSCEVQWELAGVFEERDAPGNGVVKTRRVDPEQVVCTYHQGDTEQIDGSFGFLKRALWEAGYIEAGPQREIYLFDVCQPKSRWITEIQIPVRKRDQNS
jgi:effector-binding domain-containing protein